MCPKNGGLFVTALSFVSLQQRRLSNVRLIGEEKGRRGLCYNGVTSRIKVWTKKLFVCGVWARRKAVGPCQTLGALCCQEPQAGYVERCRQPSHQQQLPAIGVE